MKRGTRKAGTGNDGRSRAAKSFFRGWRGGLLLCTVLVLSGGLLLHGNRTLTVTTHRVAFPRLPADFQGFRIVQISDLHGQAFGEGQRRLLTLVESLEPDLVVVTGDLVDQRRRETAAALVLMEGLAAQWTTLFVEGNHEAVLPGYPLLRGRLQAAGVVVLDNATMEIPRGNAFIAVSGVQDDQTLGWGHRAALQERAGVHPDQFHVLLSHKPEHFPHYVADGFDLVFSGHAHGGQFRLPFLGGVVAPGQGFFPRWSEGIHQEGDTRMVVSRGLGNSIIPLRVNNPPEVVLVELHGQDPLESE